jgi:3-oxoacyl-[acyl-carrier protein] reductase
MELGRRGHDVIVHTRADREAAAEVAREIEQYGVRARVELADLTDRGGVESLIQRIDEVDVLVNNAAIRPKAPFTDVSFDDWRRVFGIIVDAPFLLCQAYAPGMMARGWGRVIGVTGVRAMKGAAGRVSSATAKHALVGLTRTLATEVGPGGVTVNLVCPGTVRVNDSAAETDRLASRVGISALGRFGEPDDIAKVIGFLASDDGGYITGQSIGANGGELYL